MYRTGGGLRYSLISESEEAYPQRKKCSVPARHKKSSGLKSYMALKYSLEISLNPHKCEIRALAAILLDLKAAVGNGYVGAICEIVCSSCQD